MKATLILENGAVFVGQSMGATAERICELVFNTSMVGYQEIITDPTYAGQGVVLTYPLVGNYGTNTDDKESNKAWASALIVRRLSPRGSNFRNEGTLDDYLKANRVTGISGVDTRAITRILRDQGTMNAMITTEEEPDIADKLKLIRAYRVKGTVERTSRTHIKVYHGDGPKLAMLDLGLKDSLLNAFLSRGCEVAVFPSYTPAEMILSVGYDGIVLSGGPGDPADNMVVVEEVKKLYNSGSLIFGVGLGHQIMALATGAKTEKLPFGHRGSNQPVRDLETGRIYITTQSHGYTVRAESVDPQVAKVRYINVNDGSVEGLSYENGKVLTVQFHPEPSKGLMADTSLIDVFLGKMEGEENA